MNDDYILPGEFALLLAFLFLPPLILAALLQIWLMRRRNASWFRILATLLTTAAASMIASLLVMATGGGRIPSLVGVKHLWFWHRWTPVLPLAFVVIVLIAPIATFLSIRRLRVSKTPTATG